MLCIKTIIATFWQKAKFYLSIFWHIAKFYSICIKPSWHLVTVPNMNKIWNQRRNIHYIYQSQDLCTVIKICHNKRKKTSINARFWQSPNLVYIHQALMIRHHRIHIWKKQPGIFEKSLGTDLWTSLIDPPMVRSSGGWRIWPDKGIGQILTYMYMYLHYKCNTLLYFANCL